jgi:hypothetical protein
MYSWARRISGATPATVLKYTNFADMRLRSRPSSSIRLARISVGVFAVTGKLHSDLFRNPNGGDVAGIYVSDNARQADSLERHVRQLVAPSVA